MSAVPLVVFAAVWLPGCANDALDGSPTGLPADRIVLLITGHSNGTLEPCDCPSQPPGGLSRRKPLIDSLRKQWGSAILLDNGNSLWIAPDPLLDRYMLAGMAKLHYDAINVGDQELDRGPKSFAAAVEELDLPVVATNVKLADGSQIGRDEKIIGGTGYRVQVLGVVGPKKMRFASAAVREAITLADPAEAVGGSARISLTGCSPPADAVVVLADLDPDERNDIVPKLAGLADLVVLSTEQDKPVKLEHIGGVPVVYAPAGGKQIAVVVLGRSNAERAAGQKCRVVRVVGYPVDQSLPRDRELWDAYEAYLAEANKLRLPTASQPGGAH